MVMSEFHLRKIDLDLDRWADWVPRHHGKAVKQASSDWLLGSSLKELD